MISIEQCREILGGDLELSDPELEQLRDQLYRLAEIVVALALDDHGQDLLSATEHRSSED